MTTLPAETRAPRSNGNKLPEPGFADHRDLPMRASYLLFALVGRLRLHFMTPKCPLASRTPAQVLGSAR